MSEQDERCKAFVGWGAELAPVLTDVEVRRNPELSGLTASFFIDDVIWVMRDLTRQRPQSLFGNPFLSALKAAHDRFGLKLQLNLFWRTDFFYGLDEFSLAQMTDAYREEWQANRDWLKLGFHSLQEFPDYPWVNASHADVKALFGRICGEIERFAGEGVVTSACVPHWCEMSEEGCRALKECGIHLMECSAGPRFAYDGCRERLPYGHALRLEQNRKPETCLYRRSSRDASIAASICSYNHMTESQHAQVSQTRNCLYDRKTGLAFKLLFNDAPVLNLVDVPTLKADMDAVLGREHLVFSDHEQYFYRDYLSCQPDYAEKILVMAERLSANGYSFILNEDLACC